MRPEAESEHCLEVGAVEIVNLLEELGPGQLEQCPLLLESGALIDTVVVRASAGVRSSELGGASVALDNLAVGPGLGRPQR